jgi:hypothetical protein
MYMKTRQALSAVFPNWRRGGGRALSLACLCLASLLSAAPAPSEWVPVRWPFSDPQSLELLANTPVNCILLKNWPADLLSAAQKQGLITLAVLTPGEDTTARAHAALAAKVTGIVLEGEFPEGSAASVVAAAGGAPVIELTSRRKLALGSRAPVIGTYQGVWPGVSVQDDGAKKAGPTASVWIDTNTGFIRAVRGWGDATLWLANLPPPQTVITGLRYQQVIADAEMSGARWVIAFDPDLADRLHKREAAAMKDWAGMCGIVRYYEQHSDWRRMQPYGKFAIVQDPARGGLLSGGVLDMIAVKHTPVKPVPQQHLSPEALQGAIMALNVDPEGMTPEQKEILRDFARGGGTLLNGPPGWKDAGTQSDRITLEKTELDRLNDIWRDVNSTVGRRNLGVRIFNASSMLSNLLTSPDGKSAVLQLVNYSDYPVENVTAHFLGAYRSAAVIAPDGSEKKLEIFPAEEEGGSIEIPKVAVCATIKLEQ